MTMAITLGLVAVLMVSASTFVLGAYAQSNGGAGGQGGWLVNLIGNAHQILQCQVNKATSKVGQELNQVGKVLTGHLSNGPSYFHPP